MVLQGVFRLGKLRYLPAVYMQTAKISIFLVPKGNLLSNASKQEFSSMQFIKHLSFNAAIMYDAKFC